MHDAGYYLYGIVKNEPLEIKIPGIDKKEDVSIFSFNRIAAIASRVNLDEFGELSLKRNLESMDWVKDKVLGHERVIEEVMKKTTVIPMRFCIIFKTEDNISELLEKKHDYFIGLLEKCANKHEWSVKIYCHKKQEAATKNYASGRDYLISKKREEESILKRERSVNSSIEEIFKNISSLAEDARINRPTPEELMHYKDREQVLNASFFVADDRVEELTALTETLVERYTKSGLAIELAGPLPIYSFVGGDSDGKSN